MAKPGGSGLRDSQQRLPLAIGGLSVQLEAATEVVGALNSLPQLSLQCTCPFQCRRHTKLLRIHCLELVHGERAVLG